MPAKSRNAILCGSGETSPEGLDGSILVASLVNLFPGGEDWAAWGKKRKDILPLPNFEGRTVWSKTAVPKLYGLAARWGRGKEEPPRGSPPLAQVKPRIRVWANQPHTQPGSKRAMAR